MMFVIGVLFLIAIPFALMAGAGGGGSKKKLPPRRTTRVFKDLPPNHHSRRSW